MILEKLFSFFSKKCKHDPDMYLSIDKSTIYEPGKEPRDIKLRVVIVKCLKCEQILKLTSLGVAEDLERGVHLGPKDKETHADLSPEAKILLLKEIAHA